jgi:hypothetical protein
MIKLMKLIREILIWTSFRDRVLIIILMDLFIRVIGIRVKGKVLESIFFQMEIFYKANSRIITFYLICDFILLIFYIT